MSPFFCTYARRGDLPSLHPPRSEAFFISILFSHALTEDRFLSLPSSLHTRFFQAPEFFSFGKTLYIFVQLPVGAFSFFFFFFFGCRKIGFLLCFQVLKSCSSSPRFCFPFFFSPFWPLSPDSFICSFCGHPSFLFFSHLYRCPSYLTWFPLRLSQCLLCVNFRTIFCGPRCGPALLVSSLDSFRKPSGLRCPSGRLSTGDS